MSAPPLVDVTRREGSTGPVWVLTLRGSPAGGAHYENKLNDAMVSALHGALDRVEREAGGGPGAVVTVSTGKFYSNGLDVEYVLSLSRDDTLAFLRRVMRLLHRLLLLPYPTVAALNGHAYAGGFLLALAHDHRVANADKGYACMTELDLGSPLPAGLNALLKDKLPRHFAARMMLEVARVTGPALVANHGAALAAPGDKVLDAAVEFAGSLAGKGGSGTVRELKEDLFADSARLLWSGPVMTPREAAREDADSKL